MRITNASGVRNDLLQEIADKTEIPYGSTGMLPIDFSSPVLLAPHSLTTRLTYTVPADKQAVVSSLFVGWETDAVGSVVGRCEVRYNITPSGGSAVEIFNGLYVSDTVGQILQWTIPVRYHLVAGDLIEVSTLQPGTGGTVDWFIGAIIQEFDV
jgi:hypothetical protein